MKSTKKYQADLKMRSEDWKQRLFDLEVHLIKLNNELSRLGKALKKDSTDYRFVEQNRDLTVLAIGWCKRLAK